MNKTVKCRYCKKEINRDTAYSVAKGQYYCNEEHYNQQQLKKQKPKSNGTDYRIVTDYIVTIYGNQSSSYWSKLIRLLKTLSKNKGYLFTGMYGTLKYYFEVLDCNCKNTPVILYSVINDYYEEAKSYYQQTKDINSLGKDFPNDTIKYIRPSKRHKKDKRIINIEEL